MLRLPILLLGLGGCLLLIALAWWWSTFRIALGFGYIALPEAGICLLRHTEICTLAQALCTGAHPRTVTAYSAEIFWVGVGALSAGLSLVK
jgi:hypothetical protein